MSLADEFLDVLTGSLIRDPVRAADGGLYDRSTLTQWFEAHPPPSSPRTAEPM